MRPTVGEMKDRLSKGVDIGNNVTSIERGPGRGGRTLAQPEKGQIVNGFERVPIRRDGPKRERLRVS